MSPRWKDLSAPQKIAAVRMKWEPGISASGIASFFDGASRSAVIGFYHRHAKNLTDTPLRSTARGEALVARKQHAPKARICIRKERRPLPPPPIIPLEQHLCGKPMVMLKTGQCKWAVNDATPHELHLFCGIEADGPYCAVHAARGVQSRDALSRSRGEVG